MSERASSKSSGIFFEALYENGVAECPHCSSERTLGYGGEGFLQLQVTCKECGLVQTEGIIEHIVFNNYKFEAGMGEKAIEELAIAMAVTIAEKWRREEPPCSSEPETS